ncbi:MAG: hypothetical protein JSV88_13165 [Candidatus Aminicenantes bacterium]|nr:MAG: hypothetical protein JSV88_13165 [Candidatus Aminicenantes bacterium]
MNKLLRSVSVKKKAVVFTLLLTLGLSYGFAKKLAKLPQLTNPISIEIHDHELYVLDDVVVYVYSLKDYRLLRKFGKKGEGPGKLSPNSEVPLAMNIFNGDVFLNSQIKMIRFSKTGEIIKEQQIPFSFQIIPFGKNYVSIKLTVRHNMPTFNVILYDSRFNNLKALYSRERIPRSRRGKLPLPPELIIIRSSGDKLFVFDQKKDFYINVYDTEGNQLAPIKMDSRKIKVTDSFKKDALEWFKLHPSFKMVTEELREMIYFPDYLPVMRNFLVKDQKIYVQTYNTRDNLSEFITLNLKGELIKQVFLPGCENSPVQFTASNIFTFFNENYYYLEDHKGEWSLHVVHVEKIK